MRYFQRLLMTAAALVAASLSRNASAQEGSAGTTGLPASTVPSELSAPPSGDGSVVDLSPPSKTKAIAPGNVDMRTGRYLGSATDLSMGGDDEGGLSLERGLTKAVGGHIEPLGNFSHNWDIFIYEKRLDIRTGGAGTDYNITVVTGDEASIFQSYSTSVGFGPVSSTEPPKSLTFVGDRASSGVLYSYQGTDGTIIKFRALGNGDCAGGYFRCAYASQVIRPNGTIYNLEYENPTPGVANTTRLRSVTSSQGYGLLLQYSGSGSSWNLISKACVLNYSVTIKSSTNTCLSGLAEVNYTYTTINGESKLSSFRDAVGNTHAYGYVPLSGSPNPNRYQMTFTDAGQSQAKLTNTLDPVPNNENGKLDIVIQQSFTNGASFAYTYDGTPQADNKVSSIAGGNYTDNTGHTATFRYGFPVLPPALNSSKRANLTINDIVEQVTEGPVTISNENSEATTLNYCDPGVFNSTNPSLHGRCLVIPLQYFKSPEGITNYLSYSFGLISGIRSVAKSGSTLSDIIVTRTFDCSSLIVCGKPITVTDANNNTIQYAYDTVHGGELSETWPSAMPNSARPQKRFTYSQLYGQVKSASGGLVQSANPVWLRTASSQCRSLSTCAGTTDEIKTTYTYNHPDLLMTSRTVSAGDGSVAATTTWTYDDQGNRLTEDGPLPGPVDVTRWRYDAMRRVVGKIGPDPDGTGPTNPLKMRATRNTYDPAGRLIKVERGNVDSQSDADWALLTPTDVVDTVFDVQGRKVKETKSSSGTSYAVTQYSYDALGRLECTAVRMDRAQWDAQTDACTPQLTGLDGPDRVTRLSYDAAGQLRMTQVAVGVTSDQADEVINTYTPDGKLQTVTDGNGNVTTYVYDGFDRLVETHLPSPDTTGISSTTDYEKLTLDPNGNVTARQLRDGQSIRYTVDALNRVTLKDLPGSEPDLTYSYDLQGHVTALTRAADSMTQTLSYDALGRLVSDAQPYGTLAYEYDQAGRRTKLSWATDFFLKYDYFATGEMKAIRENDATVGVGVLAAFGYDNLGRRTSLTRGNGVVTTYGYDAGSRLASLANDLAATTNDVSTSFSYNAASQMVSSVRNNDLYAWNGHYNVDRPYSVNGLNQLTTAGATALGYDARGNLTTSGTTTYTYSSENLLLSGSGPTAATLTYDGTGRMMRVVDTKDSRFIYDGGKIATVMKTVSGVTTVTQRYVWGPGDDEALMFYVGSGPTDRRFFVTDERGSVVATTDATGAKQTILTYDEYGIPNDAAGYLGQVRYTGQVWLSSLGLANYKARIYSPTLGRFLQTDPTGYDDGPNWYAYVANDPVNRTDPTGLQSVDDQQLQMRVEDMRQQGLSERQIMQREGSMAKVEGAALGAVVPAIRLAMRIAEAVSISPAAQNTAKAGLSETQQANLARFEGKLPANAGPTTVTTAKDGSVTMSATSPGKVPGSSATYTKTMNAAGETTGYTKTVRVPSGETLPPKDKFNVR